MAALPSWPGQRRLRVVPGPLLEVGQRHPLDDDLVDADRRGCRMRAVGSPSGTGGDGRGAGRRLARHRGRRRWWSSAPVGLVEHLGEVVLEPVLRLRLPDAGAPQLVGDEQEDQHAGRDAGAPDRPEEPAPAASGGGYRRPRVALVASRGPSVDFPGSHGTRRPAPRRRHAPGPVPRPGRDRPGGRGRRDRAAPRARTGPGRPPCCGSAPGCCRSARGEARVLGHDLTDRRQARAAAPPGRAARPRHRPLRRAHAWPTTCGSGAGPPARAPRRTSTRRARRAAGSTAGWPACRVATPVGRPAPAHVAGVPAGPPPGAVAARRAPRRASTRRAATSLDGLVRRAVAAGATVRAGVARARPRRGARRPGRHHRRRHHRRARPGRRRPRSAVLVP